MNITLKKLRKPAIIGFAALMLVIQLIFGAGFMTGESARAALDPNDPDNIVRGGIRDKNHALSVYDSNAEIRAIYNHFGVTRQDIANTKMGYFLTNDHGGKIKTTGRKDYPGVDLRPVTIGGTTIYVGPFSDGSNQKPYRLDALVGTRSADGSWFAITLYCGNIVYVEEVKLPKPSAQCSALEQPVITNRTNVALKASASTKDGATISKYTFAIVDAAGKTVATKDVSTSAGTASTNMTIEAPGTYTAKVVVTTSVGSKDGAACAKQFTIKEQEKPGVAIEKTVNGIKKDVVEVNEEFTYELVVKNTGNTNLKNVKVEDKAPAGVTFLKADKGEVKNNAWTYTIPELKKGASVKISITAVIKQYIKDVVVNKACVDAPSVPGNPDDCDEAEVEVPAPGKDTVCELDTKKIITIDENAFDGSKHSRDVNDCKEQPVVPETPTELPRTGADKVIMGGLGLGALVTVTIAYVASRRSIIG